ncbi:MAG: hypothetical protein AAGF93_09625 [Cyanobacteria bacterium P01_H01_bin.105]
MPGKNLNRISLVTIAVVLMGSFVLASQKNVTFNETSLAQHSEKTNMVDQNTSKDSQQNMSSPVTPAPQNSRDLTVEEMQNAQPLPLPEVEESEEDTDSKADKKQP